MAMLAEQKRKRKWSLNPRGKLWCNDDSKIGQKLLEKMGWAKGKGLGREEQGDLEPIRLRYKNDSEGVGFEVKDDQWVAHREEFNKILDALNGDDSLLGASETIPVKSLEDRSKSSKSRVHYHKFTRGKDLSRYSAADMACILGKRPNEPEQEIKEVIIKEEPTEMSTNGSVEHLHGVTTIQRGSIQEYFQSKMAAVKEKQRQSLKCKQEDSGNEGSSGGDDDEEKEEKRVRINEDLNIVKEFRSKDKILKTEKTDDAITNGTMDETRPKKKKKDSKTILEKESECVLSEPLPVTNEILDNPELKKKKKKKKDTEKEIPEPVMDAEPIKMKKSKTKIEETTTVEVIQNSEHHIQEEPKKKKKTDKKQKEEIIEYTQMIQNGDDNQTPEESKKKKKKEKKQKEETNECTQIIQNDDEDQTTEEPKKKKKKSQKQEEEAIGTGNPEVTEPVQKKSKKNKLVEVPVEQVQNKDDVQPPAKKKKKKCKKDEQEMPEKYTKMNDSSIEAMQTEQITASEDMQNGVTQDMEQQIKKKKKSKRTEEEEGIPETFRKIDNSFEETELDRKLCKQTKNKTTDKVQVESIENELDVRVSKKNKKNKESAIEAAAEVLDKSIEDAQVNSTKKKSKKRKAGDMADEVAINVEKDVGSVVDDSLLQENTNTARRVCLADQLVGQADVKPNDCHQEVDQTKKKNMAAVLLEAGATKDAKKLESIELSDGSRLSQKFNRMLMRANFDNFVGSNILDIVGYGNDNLT